jgi:hypothetical protein
VVTTTQLRIYRPNSRETVYTQQYREAETCGTFGLPIVDPYTLAISYNINRRHLTAAQKSELIGKLLKADPTKSDRAVADVVEADHKTVGAKRAALAATGEIPQTDTPRVGVDGKIRKLPAKSAEARNVRPTPAEHWETVAQAIARGEYPPEVMAWIETYKCW